MENSEETERWTGEILKAPFPWFGGKSRVAQLIWERFGNVPNYVEPFFGSGAVLLGRPHSPGIETVNDANGWLTNFWRALQADPDGVAHWADYPVSELDLHARGDWLFYRPEIDEWIEKLRGDPEYYDLKSAGWWVWGQSAWIGDNWNRNAHDARRDESGTAVAVTHALPQLNPEGMHRPGVCRARPHLGDASHGIHRQSIERKRPHLGNAGKGTHRMGVAQQIPCLKGNMGIHSSLNENGGSLAEYLSILSARLRRVRICCGDWSRVCGPIPTWKQGMTGVFLDPPYGDVGRDRVYGEHDSYDTARAVSQWAQEHGNNPLMRIALCGYGGEHEMPGWTSVGWKALGGYSAAGHRGNLNATRETIWFSPSCLAADQLSLF